MECHQAIAQRPQLGKGVHWLSISISMGGGPEDPPTLSPIPHLGVQSQITPTTNLKKFPSIPGGALCYGVPAHSRQHRGGRGLLMQPAVCGSPCSCSECPWCRGCPQPLYLGGGVESALPLLAHRGAKSLKKKPGPALLHLKDEALQQKSAKTRSVGCRRKHCKKGGGSENPSTENSSKTARYILLLGMSLKILQNLACFLAHFT